MAITLLRHTLPDINQRVCYGRLDVDVADSFVDEATAVTSILKRPDKIVTSPLKRCQKLAHFVANTFNLECAVDTRLQEMDFGFWEGQLWDEIPSTELEAWAQDFLHAKPHQGESVHMLNERTESIVDEFRTTKESVLLVTHAGVIKSARYLTHHNKAEFDWSESIEFGGNLELF